MTFDELEAGLAADTLAELKAAGVVPGRPLIAVDVDEVLVVFVAHLGRYIRTLGYEMRLERYELEGSMFRLGSNDPIPFDACIELINTFFAHECETQNPIPGGAGALASLSQDAQVVILTNVPKHARDTRRRNLDALGLDYPLIVNSGGKGRAMAWLAKAADAPVAMIDDSVTQLESVAKHVPEAVRIHFAEAEHVSRLFPTCDHATCQVRSWPECEAALRAAMDLNGATSAGAC